MFLETEILRFLFHLDQKRSPVYYRRHLLLQAGAFEGKKELPNRRDLLLVVFQIMQNHLQPEEIHSWKYTEIYLLYQNVIIVYNLQGRYDHHLQW